MSEWLLLSFPTWLTVYANTLNVFSTSALNIINFIFNIV